MAKYASENRRVMAENIQRLMQEHGKTRRQVCADLHIKYTTLTEWINGGKYPRIQNIEMLAQYFGVPKSALVEDPFKPPDAPSENDRRMVAAYGKMKHALTADDVDDIILFMTMRVQRHRKAQRPAGESERGEPNALPDDI